MRTIPHGLRYWNTCFLVVGGIVWGDLVVHLFQRNYLYIFGIIYIHSYHLNKMSGFFLCCSLKDGFRNSFPPTLKKPLVLTRISRTLLNGRDDKQSCFGME